jgi:NAD(P)-dependent dehydrogenase (short-subunit alcohol dehydrogenase family)
MMTTGLLQGKVAVITGGTRGLGLAIAQAYAREGAAVVVASRTPGSVDQVVTSLSEEGLRASGRPVDVGELSQVEELSLHALRDFGRMDIWVNNAGLSAAHGPTIHVPPEEVSQVIHTNVLGAYHGSLVALRHFLPQGRGKLINVLGRGARGPVAFGNAYASSKAWLRSFTMAMAKEYKDYGVGIYAFNPGLVDTDLLRKFRVIAGYEKRANMLKTVMRMWANPPEVAARKAAWLASDATDGRTGLDINMLGPTALAGGALREGVNQLLRRPAPAMDLNVISVPAALDLTHSPGDNSL